MCCQVADVAFRFVLCVFDPVDNSRCTFFESLISALVRGDNVDETVPRLWEMCAQVAGTEPGKFVAISALKAAAQEGGRHYLSRTEDLVELTMACLASEVEVTRDVALAAVSDFAPIFEKRNVPALLGLAARILEAARQVPVRAIVEPLSLLLGSIHDTSAIIDPVLGTMLQMVQALGVSVGGETITCISAVMKTGAPCIARYVDEIVWVIRQCFGIPDEHGVSIKIAAMEVLRVLLEVHYRDLVRESMPLYVFLANCLHSEHFDLTIGSLSVLQTILENYPDADNIVWETIDFAFLARAASDDVSVPLPHPPWDRKPRADAQQSRRSHRRAGLGSRCAGLARDREHLESSRAHLEPRNATRAATATRRQKSHSRTPATARSSDPALAEAHPRPAARR